MKSVNATQQLRILAENYGDTDADGNPTDALSMRFYVPRESKKNGTYYSEWVSLTYRQDTWAVMRASDKLESAGKVRAEARAEAKTQVPWTCQLSWSSLGSVDMPDVELFYDALTSARAIAGMLESGGITAKALLALFGKGMDK